MGTATQTNSFVADNLDEFNLAVAQLDAYAQVPDNPALLDRVDDEQTLTITYRQVVQVVFPSG